jgi:anthranilate phosphoribosyltransferase
MCIEEKIKTFGGKVTELINKKCLARQEVKEMFSQVLLNEQPELQQGAFFAALVAKGETLDEIAGTWEAIYEFDTVKAKPTVPQPLVENCGTGMDGLKTFNISTAASIVAAAGGVFMAKHGARAITSRCGAVDILEAVGVDVECEAEIVKKSIERAGIGIFNGMSPNIHPALARILSQIRFGTTLNIAASLANPALPRYGVRGVYAKELVEPVAQIMKEIGYKRAIVVHGLDEDEGQGMDEASINGESIIAELEDGKVTTYKINPEDFGIRRANYQEIMASSLEEEVKRFLALLSGKEDGPRQEIVCLNAALVFYLFDQDKDLKKNYIKAKEILGSGQAMFKLKQWVKEQN